MIYEGLCGTEDDVKYSALPKIVYFIYKFIKKETSYQKIKQIETVLLLLYCTFFFFT